MGYDVVRRHFYSPIPDLESLPPEVWERESDLAGVRLDAEAGLGLLRGDLAPFLAEFAPSAQPAGDPDEFYLDNALYERIDAEVLYAMVRHLAPRRVVELGSGFSSLVIAAARERGGNAGPSGHRIFDPYPRPELRPRLERAAELRPVPVADVPLAELEALGSGDVLFVDTTHTVKVGSDVNRIVLDFLPRLRPGVVVHFHDIFLPWEYPREFMEERRFFWAEQYLLQAFLAFNDKFEVLLALHALQRRFPEELAELVPSARPQARPSAMWLRRRSD